MSALDTQIGGSHYKDMPIQPMEFSMANNLDACQHTVIKYVSRFREKGGVQDLEKAKHVIDMLIEFEGRAQAAAKSMMESPEKDVNPLEAAMKAAEKTMMDVCGCPDCVIRRFETEAKKNSVSLKDLFFGERRKPTVRDSFTGAEAEAMAAKYRSETRGHA